MKRIVTVVVCLALLCGCAKNTSAERHTKTVFAMDTVMELSIYGDEELLNGCGKHHLRC